MSSPHSGGREEREMTYVFGNSTTWDVASSRHLLRSAWTQVFIFCLGL